MRHVCVLLLSCCISSGLAFAQDEPRGEIFGGYSYLNIDTNGLSSRQNANGWEAAISGNFDRWFAVEGDVSEYYKSYSIDLASLGLGCAEITVGLRESQRLSVRPST